MTVVLDGSSLGLADVVRVARERERVELAPAALDGMREARAVVERALARGDEVYGLSTGVGARKKVAVAPGEAAAFNRALLANHVVATGPDVEEDGGAHGVNPCRRERSAVGRATA